MKQGAIFGLKKSQISRVLERMLNYLSDRLSDFVNTKYMDTLGSCLRSVSSDCNCVLPFSTCFCSVTSAFTINLHFVDDFFLKDCVGVVDTTEVTIQAWVGQSFSGKKKNFTLKYQVVRDLQTRKPIHIAGPYLGKVHDSKIWRMSGFGNFLEEDNLFVLGDKGYVGCRQVHNVLKKNRGQKVLNELEKEYNRMISQKRIVIENHFAELKIFKVLSHTYRGDLNEHWKIFAMCEILLIICLSSN